MIIIAGPTASGKSALAADLAKKVGGVVINADSMQSYAEVRILSARPSGQEMANVPHLGYGVLSVTERSSAGWWLRETLPMIEGAWADGRTPVLAGGTGLYIRSLMSGIAQVPAVPDEITAAAEERYDAIGGEAFLLELDRRDKAAADKLPPQDRQRLIRAYAVYEATGKSLTDWQAEQSPGPAIDATYNTVLLAPPREELYARCDARFDRMMEEGALGEVRTLMAMDLDPRLPATRLLGAPELTSYLNGQGSLEDAVAKAKRSTRQFAKRQMTWFRGQYEADVVLTALESNEDALNTIWAAWKN